MWRIRSHGGKLKKLPRGSRDIPLKFLTAETNAIHSSASRSITICGLVRNRLAFVVNVALVYVTLPPCAGSARCRRRS